MRRQTWVSVVIRTLSLPALLSKFTSNHVSSSTFVSAYLLSREFICCFCLLDSEQLARSGTNCLDNGFIYLLVPSSGMRPVRSSSKSSTPPFKPVSLPPLPLCLLLTDSHVCAVLTIHTQALVHLYVVIDLFPLEFTIEKLSPHIHPYFVILIYFCTFNVSITVILNIYSVCDIDFCGYCAHVRFLTLDWLFW